MCSNKHGTIFYVCIYACLRRGKTDKYRETFSPKKKRRINIIQYPIRHNIVIFYLTKKKTNNNNAF